MRRLIQPSHSRSPSADSTLTRKAMSMTLRMTSANKIIWASVAILLAFILSQAVCSIANAQVSRARPPDKPFVVEYYYKAKWGHADEFIRLFKKNHYPLLKKQIELGNALQVRRKYPSIMALKMGDGITASNRLEECSGGARRFRR